MPFAMKDTKKLQQLLTDASACLAWQVAYPIRDDWRLSAYVVGSHILLVLEMGDHGFQVYLPTPNNIDETKRKVFDLLLPVEDDVKTLKEDTTMTDDGLLPREGYRPASRRAQTATTVPFIPIPISGKALWQPCRRRGRRTSSSIWSPCRCLSPGATS